MKLLINTSTLSASGVTQVSTSFIYECLKFPENDYHILTSPTVEQQINKSDFPAHFHFYSIPNHPLYGWKGFKSRKLIRKLAEDIHPDVVFSVFGPSWWTPKVPHLQGYAYPYYVYPESPVYEKLSFIQKLKIDFFKAIHLKFLDKNGDYYVSETDDVSRRFENLMKKPNKKYYTVTNTVNNFFIEYKKNKVINKNILPEKQENEFRFLSLCTYHFHKNLNILNEVIPILNKELPHNQIKFIFTISAEDFEMHFTEEAKKSIINIGRVPVKDCPQLYEESDALFLPTLLECFSANYPEAMLMERPILTSNLSFATEVCGNAAKYFDPISPPEIVALIIELVSNKELQAELILNGKEKLKDFDDSFTRAKKYLDICKNIVQ